MSRVSRYATSTKNIVGCTVAIAGPVLALTGVVGPAAGLVLVVPLYCFGALVAPKQRAAAIDAADEARQVRKALNDARRQAYAGAPGQIASKVNRIADRITETLPRADSLGRGSPAHYVLVRCATDYLPETLHAYLDLPRTWAKHQAVSDGRTPLALVVEQLDVLGREIDEIAEAVNRADTDKLFANGRFLDEKFGKHALDQGNAGNTSGNAAGNNRLPPG